MNYDTIRGSFRKLYRSVFPGDAEPSNDETPPPVDEASLISDLHIFLAQLGRWIADHLEYENRVGRELPSDSGLILRFRLDDYVAEVVEFFSRKRLFEGDTNHLFRAGIEVLLPPEHIRDGLSWRIRRELFGRLLQQISLHTAMPYPVVTRKFYDHLAERDGINGISREQVLESFQEAIAELSRVHDAVKEPIPEGTETPEEMIDTAALFSKTLVACGATNAGRLQQILSRRYTIDFVWLVILYTVGAAAAIVAAEPITAYLTEQLSLPIGAAPWQIVVFVVYVTQITVRIHRLRYRAVRRKTLIRVANVLADSLQLTYKEVDDVLKERYDTDLKRLKTALVPRSRPRRS